uniref:Arginine/serine-rich family protein n=1 Tax=Rhizophora mucronata TaxID=61149 RepID=A0A2P2JSW8_RHIMU
MGPRLMAMLFGQDSHYLHNRSSHRHLSL